MHKPSTYTSGFPDKKFFVNWDEFGLDRKDSYTVEYPMAINMEQIVGMRFNRRSSLSKIESLSNMIGQIVHLEYINKVARREVDDNSKFFIELKMLKYKGQEPPHAPPKPILTNGPKVVATP